MTTKFMLRFLQTLIWFAWQVFPIEEWFRLQRRVVFSKVRIDGKMTVEGDIKKMKVEFGQRVRVTVKPIGGKGFEAGTEKFSVKAQGADGEDRSGDWEVTPNPSNPFPDGSYQCDFQHSGENESMGVLAFEADGDRDVDETATVAATLDIVVDEPNVTAVEMTGEVVSAPTEGGDTGGGSDSEEPVI